MAAISSKGPLRPESTFVIGSQKKQSNLAVFVPLVHQFYTHTQKKAKLELESYYN